MKEKVGNLWENHPENVVIVTTNGYIKSDGTVAMGKGCAREAALKFPQLPDDLGILLKKFGNIPIYIPKYKIYTLPTKNNWWELSHLELVVNNIKLLQAATATLLDTKFDMPRPGCGYGMLDWNVVKPAIEEYLDDRFTVYTYDY